MEDHIDELLAHLGTGGWNLFHFLGIGFAVNLLIPHSVAGAFMVPRLKYKCRNPTEEADVIFQGNYTKLDSCSYFVKLPNGRLEEKICTSWDFDNSVYDNTITSEFSLVCDKDYFRATYQSLYMIGVLVGSPFNGILSDRYGRKTTFVWGTLTFVLIANISCWLPDLTSLMVFRFLLGMMHTTVLKTGYILAMEMAAPNVRTTVGILLFIPWSLSTAAWGGLAYLIRNWRYLLMAVSIPGVLLLPLLWHMDESLRWLLVKGEHEKAMNVLKKAKSWNKATISTDIIEAALHMRKNKYEVTKVSEVREVKKSIKEIMHDWISNAVILFRTPRLRLASIVMHLNFFVLGMVYFGLALSGGNFNFNEFSFMALMGVVELPAYTVLAPIVSQFGRKLPVAFSFLLAGMVLLALPIIPDRHIWATITLVLIGKMGTSMSFQGNNLYASELFPTDVRTRGISFSFMLSRIGSSIAPFITEYLGMLYSWAPSVLFGGASVTAGLATLSLWETLGRPMPNTIEQLESDSYMSKETRLSAIRNKKETT